MDNTTKALARMNMILHDCPTAEIWQDNSLSSPHFKGTDGRLKTFDFVVANPPFSTKAWSNGFHPEADEFKRFEFGIPPKKNGDYAFLLHILTRLKSTGKGAVILPHGVLFRGNVEAAIRREIVKRGYVKGIIGLPANLFYGMGIPACILVLDKENAHARKGIFMIDASQRVAPFFDDFLLEPDPLNEESIRLAWKHKNSDQYFGASALSDGSLRFIVLATLFLQPERYRPSVIVVDEPELGLHPYAITLLASLMKQASVMTQVIVSTQSSLLLDHFQPQDVLVADRVDGGTHLTRLDPAPLSEWLEDYSLGQLWEKNELGGRPSPG